MKDKLHSHPRPAPERPGRESVSGLIERVTFFSEETGFAVLRVKVKGCRDLVTVVGTAPSVSAGEWLTTEGRWVRDREHGLQFKAELLACTPPTTREGIEKYLGSGMVKGIGPVYARKLVERFGEEVFQVIENFSARLEEVDGIGPGRRARIKQAWVEQKHIREIMVFLHSHGVSTSRAVRIFKTYGDSAVERVRENPYLLARDIHGIGFHTADQIAQRVGIPKDSILRARAGVTHTLVEAADAGHCALPRTDVTERAAQLLEVDSTRVSEAIDHLIQSRELRLELFREEPLLFLPALAAAEARIADRILRMASQPAAFPPINLEKAIEWCETRTGKALVPGQREALGTALRHRILIITGGPGVGKTTLLNSLLAILRAKKVRCLLCAPTGRAAKKLTEATGMPAQTIHRLLEYQGSGGRFMRNESRPLDTDILVVDETSMVDVSLMSALLRAVPEHGHLILVGDVDQLPSVGPGSVLSDLLASGRVPVARLTEIFRQAAGSRIITAAHEIRAGRQPQFAAKEETSDFYFIQRDEPEAILKVVLEMVQRRIPAKLSCHPIADIQVLTPMNRGSLGVRELNLHLQSVLNPSRQDQPVVEKFGWKFRVGDKVIQTENNYDKEVFNGDIGVISSIDPSERELMIRYDDRSVPYDWGELDEVSLAYAITVHRAQGSEFPVVVIPVATQQYLLLQRNLLYTAVTRGRRLVLLVGQRRAVAIAVRNDRTVQRVSALLDRLQS